MRKFWVACAAAVVAAGLGVGIAWAASEATTGTNVACATATATTPPRTITFSATGTLTIAGASQTASHCVTQTYTVPTVTETVTHQATASISDSETSTAPTSDCDLNATTDDFAAQFATATSGQTICLASGSYGSFAGAAKSGRVTIEPATGAKVDMTVNFDGAANITVTGITLDSATLQGATHDVTLSNSTVPASGQILVMPDQMTASSDIVIDHDTLANQSCTSFGVAGRIDVQDAGDNNSNPVGLTISNNTLSGGSADGIQLDAGSGVRVIGNTFTQLNDQDPCHTDDIQFYGSATNTTIDGNFFYSAQNLADCSVSGFNDIDHMTFENNVIAGTASTGCGGDGGGDGSIALYGDDGSVIEHNVLAPTGTCSGNPCDVGLDFASPDVSGTGTVIRDNIMSGVGNTDSGTTFSEDHNLCTDANCQASGDLGPGTGDIVDKVPQFVGGANPTTYDGFALATGSPGIGAASDGTNMGIDLPTGS